MIEQIEKLRKFGLKIKNENERLLEYSKKKAGGLDAVRARVEILRSEYELLKEEYVRLTGNKGGILGW